MTSGTRTEDGRTLTDVYFPAFGEKALIGTYRQKIWSGADSPPTPKAPKAPKPFIWVPYTGIRYLPNRNGKVVRTVVNGKTLRKSNLSTPRTPRMKRSREPHNYTMTYRFSYDSTGIAHVPVALGGPASYPITSFWVAGAPVVPPPLSADADTEILSKLRAKIAGSDFNLGVFLAEGKEALSMIFNAAYRIKNSLTCLKKGNLILAARWLLDGSDRKTHPKLGPKNTIAQNWLELQYGWLPLLNDAETGAEFLAHLHSVPRQTRIRVQKVYPYVQPRREDGFWIDAVGERRLQMIAYLTETDVVTLSGLTDAASVAWELLPYSFVVDRFIPISNYLQDLALARSLKGTFVRTDSMRMRCGSWNPYPVPDTAVSFSCGGSAYREVSIDRTVTSTLQVPSPKFRGLEKAMSWNFTNNMVALLIQKHGTGSN